MNKTRALVLAGCAMAFAVSLSSCKTTPPAAEETQPVASVVTDETKPTTDDSLNSLYERVESRRKECLKYKLDARLPSDWVVAEAARDAGIAAQGKDTATAEKSFSEALAKYEEILKLSFAEINVELDSEIKAARDADIAVGADTYYPAQFVLADETVAKIAVLRETCEYTNAYDTAQLALLRYNTLQKCVEAVLLRQKNDASGFAVLAPDAYNKAGQKYDEAVSLYGTADAASLDAIIESIKLYEGVGNAAGKARADEMKAKADEIRALADSIKASRSMKDEYAAAGAKYSEAVSFGNSGAWDSAAQTYEKASSAFTSVYQNTLLKRNGADAAIAAAKEKQAASTQLANKADEIAPLPENAEGFTEENAVVETPVVVEEPK